MSRKPKHPGLREAAEEIGLKFHTVNMRVYRGMTPVEALLSSVHRRAAPLETATYMWDRPGYVKAPRRKRGRQPGFKPTRKGKEIEDTSPPHIRALRKTLCDGFIKTGELDADILVKLKGYADAIQRPHIDARRISAQSQVEDVFQRRASLRYDGGGNDMQPDDAAA